MMPPDNVIPPHYDTGYWVNKCHRIHVPITTNLNVEFNVIVLLLLFLNIN